MYKSTSEAVRALRTLLDRNGYFSKVAKTSFGKGTEVHITILHFPRYVVALVHSDRTQLMTSAGTDLAAKEKHSDLLHILREQFVYSVAEHRNTR